MATQTFDKIVWERRLQILETSLGADIMHYMHQDDVTEVMVNPDGKLWIDRFGVGFEDTGIRMDRQYHQSKGGSIPTGRHSCVASLFELSLSGRTSRSRRRTLF